MDFCIPKQSLGIDVNIVIKCGEYIISNQIPGKTWVAGLDSHPMCADILCQIYGSPLPNVYTDQEARSFASLGKSPKNVPWAHVLGPDVLKKRIGIISGHLTKTLDVPSRADYNNIYIFTRSLLGSLSPARVCVNQLEKFLAIEQNSSLRTCLETFRPVKGESASPVTYSQTSTSTGRLTVSQGPSILTLPAKYRSILKSRYKGGSIMSIDFRSLEPRVALLIRGKEAPEDIYTYIAKEILGDKTTRSVAKLATIAALYGISFKKFQQMSGCEDYSVLDRVKDFFAVKTMTKNLSVADFKNYWGRPLDNHTLPHVRVSHFIQSTSCDTVNVGFYNLLELLKNLNAEVTPIFVLHDALILDVPPTSMDKIKDVCSNGLKTPLGNFPSTCEKF